MSKRIKTTVGGMAALELIKQLSNLDEATYLDSCNGTFVWFELESGRTITFQVKPSRRDNAEMLSIEVD